MTVPARALDFADYAKSNHTVGRFCKHVTTVQTHRLQRVRQSSSTEACLGWRKIAISVRRASAVKLVDDLTGESPVSADYPVGTVVIFGDGTGDQAVGSPD